MLLKSFFVFFFTRKNNLNNKKKKLLRGGSFGDVPIPLTLFGEGVFINARSHWKAESRWLPEGMRRNVEGNCFH